MKLKKIEITGFKSFSEKSVIPFPTGVSAIVGPNGCGKSNIVDAIRWVMGEQSVKQLRGKSMEDVIFAGTDGKLPLNMAEVSLTLLNDNGSAPEALKDFSEINITRRLFRSGERSYFLNKQPCRLKDIHNIFLGSGMGARSYAVIQQGNIGAITDAGPDERRFFIEEAAGVTRYKSRKEEALRKVKATNQNLLRIADIISEVNRQMNSLKRQARKAERFKRYQDRIKDLEVLSSIYYYDDYTSQINDTDALLKSLKDSDIEHSSRINKLDAAIEGIQFQREKKEHEIAAQKNMQYETQRKTDKVESDIEHFRKEVERLSDETKELELIRIDLDQKNSDMASEILQVKEQNKVNEQGIKETEDALEKEKSASGNIRERLAQLKLELENYKTEHMELIAREALNKNNYQNVTSNKESLGRRLKRIDEEEFTAGRKVSELRSSDAKAKKHLEIIKAEIEELNSGINVLKKQLDEHHKSLSGQIKFVQTKEIQRNKSKSEYAALKKMDENFEWYKDGVKAIMRRGAGKTGQGGEGDNSKTFNDGVIGLMADIIEPEPDYEIAVEAVLGEYLQYILVNDQESGLESINYLQKSGAGRSGFLPVSLIRSIECGRGEKPQSSRLLLNHISVKSGYENITESLLGHVIVEDNVEDAVQVWNRHQGEERDVLETIVTKNGDVISPHGIMIGGSKDKLSGILAKKKEIKELKRKIVRFDRELEEARNKQKEKEIEVRKIESDLQKLIEKKKNVSANQIEAEKALYKVSEDLKHAIRHLEIVHLEQEQLVGEKNDINDELDKYKKVIDEIEGLVKNAQDKVAKATIDINTVSSELEEFDNKVVDLQLKLTTLNAKSENSSNTLRRLMDFQADGKLRIEQLAKEIAQKKDKEKWTKDNIIKLEGKLAVMYEEYRSVKDSVENNEKEFQTIGARLKENGEIISKIQSKREEIIEKFRYMELEQSQRQIQRDNIINRLQERYHGTIEQFKTEYSDRLDDELTIEQLESELARFRERISKIVDVNLGAITEYEQLKERHVFLTEQHDDLIGALDDLRKVIAKINRITQKKFLETFEKINSKLDEVFPRLFEGGSAKLVLTSPDNPLETGVEFMVHPPGKKLTRLSLLSGGEKALSEIAFIFSIFLIKPASFCLLDEIDAPLDDANIHRFNNLLKIIGEKSQIVMITHNKESMEFADILLGVTMEKKGISQVVSVDLQRAN
ncbi:MAG: chromosome segregation protein SMC [Desulfobacteraceae bacterium]|nr:chromosome segregation protein SMC [Desulfobacteraceae bacterium]